MVAEVNGRVARCFKERRTFFYPQISQIFPARLRRNQNVLSTDFSDFHRFLPIHHEGMFTTKTPRHNGMTRIHRPAHRGVEGFGRTSPAVLIYEQASMAIRVIGEIRCVSETICVL